MRPTERCGGRGQAPGTAGQTRGSTASVADHVGAGKQAALTRRHLDESQRAMVASLDRGERADRSIDLSPVTQQAAAELLNVSRPTESAQICAVTQTQAALTRLGEMLKATPKNTGAAGSAGPGRGNAVPIANRVSDVPTLADLGIDKKVSVHGGLTQFGSGRVAQ